MKIFIVEDDLVIAESLANELSKWNYEVHVVDNFEKIMEDFRRVEPQLVLLDINLPTLMASIGAKKYEKYLVCLLCLLVQEQIIWIKFWLFKWVAMILSRNHLTCL